MPTVKLTELTIKNLTVPAVGQIIYTDLAAGFPGFGIRVSAGGAKTFIVAHGPTNKRERSTLASV